MENRRGRRDKKGALIGDIIPVFLTVVLYSCTSILTVLYFIKDCSFKAQTKCMSSVLSPFFIHFVTALKLVYFTKLRRVSIEVQKYRSIVRSMHGNANGRTLYFFPMLLSNKVSISILYFLALLLPPCCFFFPSLLLFSFASLLFTLFVYCSFSVYSFAFFGSLVLLPHSSYAHLLSIKYFAYIFRSF